MLAFLSGFFTGVGTTVGLSLLYFWCCLSRATDEQCFDDDVFDDFDDIEGLSDPKFYRRQV